MTPRPLQGMPLPVAYALAIFAGGVLACSVGFGPVPFLAFSFPALLLPALARATTLRQTFLIGWAAGTGCNAVAFVWIAELLVTFGHFPAIAAWATAALLWAAQGLTFAFATLFAESVARRGAPRWIVLPAAFVVTSSWVPALFPWRPGSGLVEWVEFAQIAELGGTPLVDAAVLFSSAALSEALLRRRRLPMGVAALCLLGPLLYGALRVPSVDAARAEAPHLQVGVVQPNIGILEKHDARRARRHLTSLRDLTAAVSRADLVIWPETALPFPLARDARQPPGGGGRLSPLRDDGFVPLLFGAVTQSGRCDRWNSAVAMNAQGEFIGRSDKVELLAFGETVPLWEVLPPLQTMFPCPGMRAGARPEVLTLEGTELGVLNCYEDVLAHHARSLAQLQPELLVNLTNDAWFGQTQEPHLHQLVARWRTIETRRELVRVVNTGVSSHIDAAGRTLFETPTFVRTSFVADAARLTGTTPWTFLGDITTPGCALLLLAFAWRYRARR